MDNDLHTSTFGQPEEKILYGYNNINDDDDRRLRRRTGPDFVRRRRFRTIRRRARLPDRVWSIEGPNAAATGILRAMSARFSRAEVTTPTVVAVPTDTMSGSDVLIPSTGRSSATPTTRSRRFTSTDIFMRTSGKVPGGPTTRPTRPSAFVRTGSRFVPIAMSPPGRTSFRAAPPLWRERTVVVRFFHSVRFPTVTCRPGEISISSPTFALPCIRLPPRTPPTIFSGGIPGWFTSKDRATYIFAGFDSSRGLVGITFWIIMSRTSRFTSWWALTGTIGEPSATVPLTNA